ncbi:hypothetical protein BKA62DRAFT_751048 [Auriculariales sp. MPI-PUGE-AT-0066]|nr:hypothetical protein BKA62DRAFT_751048 [Auriculariales sp. MPI-PUGE-AT-0066]
MFSLALISLISASSLVAAQADGPVPAANSNPTDTTQLRLVGKHFSFDALPFQADTSAPTTNPVYRGPQSGYNNCTGRASSQDARSSTTFCVFAPADLSPIGDAEGEVVAWCTKPTHGSRVIPAGTLTGVQFIKAPSYVEVTGFFNQVNLDIPDGDAGGELDSGGQDQRGNPIGGLAYSSSLPTTEGKMTQSSVWHLFIGNGMFCMKLCDNNAANPEGICRHTLDTVGCGITVPAQYTDGVFLACDSNDQAPVATDVSAIPASSNCVTYQSTSIYPVTSGIPTATVASGSSTGTGSASGSATTQATSTSSTKSTAAGSGSSNPTTTAAAGSATSVVGVSLLSIMTIAYFSTFLVLV